MRELSIDIETYSSEPLKTAGVHRYTESPDFEILLFGFAFEHEPVRVVEGVKNLPAEVFHALTDPQVLKTAHNAVFERTCIAAATGLKLDPRQWECTMVKAMMLGLPPSLDYAGRALDLETTKDATGKALIRYFTVPCKPTKANGHRHRNLPDHDPEKWAAFRNYCAQDVEQERLIKRRLSFFTQGWKERDIWALDNKINDRGVLVDLDLAGRALKIFDDYVQECFDEAIELTGITNPRSVDQVKGWLESAIGEPVYSLTKKDIPELKDKAEDFDTLRVLELRQEIGKTSVSKYAAMIRCSSDDSRALGMLQYYGGARTGRWAGRRVQVQNLPRNTMRQLEIARDIVKNHDLEAVKLLWKSPSDVLSQLLRTAFIAGPGKTLLCSDFSAIEARVISWLAKEAWRLEVFRTHGKIYEASASTMFKVPIESIGKGSDLRQRGKVSELALGFGGGPDALKRMGALEMGIPEEELPKLVRMWRNASPKIVQYWKVIENAAIDAVGEPGRIETVGRVSFQVRDKVLFIKLPSGRELCYWEPRLRPGRFEGSTAVTYIGVNQYTNRWERLQTYGGKIVENIVQAIARDLLADAMLRLDQADFSIVMHVHDEAVLEVLTSQGKRKVQEVNEIMTYVPEWATGLPLVADSFLTPYYRKEE